MGRPEHLFSVLLLAGAASLSPAMFRATTLQGKRVPCTAGEDFRLAGITSPAMVAESIFVRADGLTPHASVDFYIDHHLVGQTSQPPYWLGGVDSGGQPNGFRLQGVALGRHVLQAQASFNGRRMCSSTIQLHIIQSDNASYSHHLTPYRHQFAAEEWEETAVSPTTLSQHGRQGDEAAMRQEIFAMYSNWGMNLFLDADSDRSSILRALTPKNWAHPNFSRGRGWSMMFSPDAVFYHPIPKIWPRVALPAGYFQSVQLNTAYGGDGIGFGEVTAKADSRQVVVRSQWYSVQSTLEEIPFRIPPDWAKYLPTTEQGDRHLIFIDPETMSFVSAYKASVRPRDDSPAALYAAGPTSFDSLGDRGGSIAANFAELPVLIQPGEITDPIHPIAHAIGGPVRRVWAARVYPASAWDTGVRDATDSCSGKGLMNTGLIPYGGIVQLDPKLDLDAMNLSLPALRILQAMQTYGYYVMDYGCSDIDIYTALNAAELEPYGGLWGSDGHSGVQNEISKVLRSSQLYVVAPLIKKE